LFENILHFQRIDPIIHQVISRSDGPIAKENMRRRFVVALTTVDSWSAAAEWPRHGEQPGWWSRVGV